METNFAIKSTLGLKVRKLSDRNYIAWTPNPYGIIPPKLKYKEDYNGNVLFMGATGQLKAILLNLLIWCGVIILSNIFFIDYPLNFNVLTPLIIGFIIFLIFLNYVSLYATKWKVKNQLKNRKLYANKKEHKNP